VNPSHSISTRVSEPHQRTSGRWPVLARLPEVTAEVPDAALPSGRASNSGTLEYRFDPPQTRAAEPAVRVERRWREKPRESAVLPSSDPFAIPAQSLQHTLAPIVRFLMLVALFTIAGTIILLSRAEKRPAIAPQPRAFTQQSLQPVVTAIEPPAAGAAAQGPIESDNSPTVAPDVQSTALPQSASAEETVHAAQAPAAHSMSQSDPPSADYSEQALPQVQTAEPPRAVAHLPGYILEAPAHQASNDDDQSSIH
jgi:hypothetical protein